jgi:hypothetical protein
MPLISELETTLLRTLLDRELEAFRRRLSREKPGLSAAEITRYMRGARAFAGHLVGDQGKTRGRRLGDSGDE